MAKEVHVILKGDCYSMNTYCSTLKEFLEMRNLKRSDVSDWWKESWYDYNIGRTNLRRVQASCLSLLSNITRLRLLYLQTA